jgi:hypothetical protein
VIDLAKLRRSLAKLPSTAERPIARRNARKRVLGELRRVRAELDREFPAIVVRATVKRLKTVEGRIKRLERKGWDEVDEPSAAEFAAAGVPLQRHVLTEGRHRYRDLGIRYYVPGWAVAIGSKNPSKLRAAKRSVTLQRAAVASALLLKGT